MRKFLSSIIAAAAVATGITLGASAPASADVTTCAEDGVWTLAAGGFSGTHQATKPFTNADHQIDYDPYEGNAALVILDNAIQSHRTACPTDQIKMVGHSFGAGLIHRWVSQHQTFPNAHATLVADPKRAPGPYCAGAGGNIFALWEVIGGTDANFGSFPVHTVFRQNDFIANTCTSFQPYQIPHNAYSFDVNAYSTSSTGITVLAPYPF